MSTTWLVTACLDDHLVLRVDGELDVVADANLRMGGHPRLSGSGSDIWLSTVLHQRS
jgi:hypothetical protein